ncbi:MAG: type II secretion system secretin GspD, partial [Hyphomicrobiaceae bacterium]|nr:type II secretion system secretin GspD [Hyphomicrobiaceae bacterium]
GESWDGSAMLNTWPNSDRPSNPAGPALRALLCIAVSSNLAACALPAQQLALPGALAGPTSTGSIPKKGVPLTDGAGRGYREPEIVRGTGQFTNSTARDDGTRGDGSRADATGTDQRRGAANGARAQASETGDGITLNLAGASIPEVAKIVLGDTLGLNYSVADGVKGAITLSTARPIPKKDLLAVFETLIRAEGAAMQSDNGLYRIVPSDGAGPGPLRRPGPGGLASSIMPLKFVAADEMQRILSSLAPKATVIRSEAARNILIVSGTDAEVASIRETVATFDVDQMRGMSFGIFPLDSADPEAIAAELDTVFSNDRSGPGRGVVRFVPNKRLKAVLVMSPRPEHMATAEKWVRRLDKAGQDNEKQVNVYHVRNRPAGELAQLLNRVYSPAGRSDTRAPVAPTVPSVSLSSFSTPDSGTAVSGGSTVGTGQVGEPRPIIPPFTPFAVPLPSGQSPAAAAPGQGGQATADVASAAGTAAVTAAGGLSADDRTSGIQVISDDTNNSLVITATKAEYQRVRKILSQIDTPQAQVLLEATIAEVTLNDQLRFGLRWFFEGGPNRFSLTDVAAGTVASRFPGFSYFLNTPDIQIALNALADVTDVNIVSSPSLTTLDNKRAVLQVGDEVPVATQSAVSIVAPGAPIVNSVTFRNTGVILGITPRIGENGRVLLEIEQEVSEAVATSSSTIDSPTIRQRRIKTTVAVPSGESIVLAGFMQDRASKGRQQVPLLGDVPVVGNLFKDKNDRINRTELLIAITPQILADVHQIRGAAAEFRDRLNLTTRPQRQAPPDRHEQFDRIIR